MEFESSIFMMFHLFCPQADTSVWLDLWYTQPAAGCKELSNDNELACGTKCIAGQCLLDEVGFGFDTAREYGMTSLTICLYLLAGADAIPRRRSSSVAYYGTSALLL